MVMTTTTNSNVFVNLTPHTIVLNDGREFLSEGIARVSASFTEFVDDVCCQQFGEVTGLPEPVEGTRYIVSALVLSAAKAAGRTDVVAPATGHPLCVRENGFIKSVPGFVF